MQPDGPTGPPLDKEPAGSGCDLCDGCDLPLFVRLSTLLLLLARVVPDTGGAPAVRALLRFCRDRLTRFAPIYPSTPSCSAYATAAVGTLGVRRGLVATARRLHACGRRSRPRGGARGADAAPGPRLASTP